MSKRLFAVVAGPRLGGKTTIAGTLPGKTHLLQAAVLESGSRSAQALAKRNGNELVVETFTDLVDLWPKLDKASKSNADHIYIDGFSAINDLRWGSDDMQRLAAADQWKAFGKHGSEMVKILRAIKEYSYGAQNVFITAALRQDTLKDGTPTVELECKGKMGATEITKIGEAVLTVMLTPSEQGMKRVLITKTQDMWPGRIDGLLDEDNPATMPPDLSQVLALLEV